MKTLDTHAIARTAAALLFVAEGPVGMEQLAKVLEVGVAELQQALAEVAAWLEGGGLALQQHGAKVQVVTSADVAPYVERFLGLDLSNRLSPAALEVLAIIAYRQPIARAEIEAVRGVSCDGVLRTLTSKGLVGEVGRLEQPGRPILYGTTFEFLQYFGLRQVQELPPLPVKGAAAQGSPADGDAGAGVLKG
ncbi:MAG TPA: SMC-Scp complex subunit ScpB [Anaerolineae bacterium]|nr:SMC-Scp complex subunit ScpB [Anaerolineae bacterium]HOQ98886.1 SMC-Scp complex subunit ScpB [Anaerolineae bacterium]HPL27401.1 SMC-Scp complex subunit ScpB [Anaerolineae bacterium]